MNEIELGQAYEHQICSREGKVDYRWGPFVDALRQLLSEDKKSLKFIQDKNGFWNGGKVLIVKTIPYDIIGKAISETEFVGKYAFLVELEQSFKERNLSIKNGNYLGREIKKNYAEEKQELIDGLVIEAQEAADKYGISGCEIIVERIDSADVDDFTRENGSYQLISMSNLYPGKKSENFGVIIKNSKGQIVKNLLGRETTVHLNNDESETSDSVEEE